MLNPGHRRLPKCREPPQLKTHWDYLLDEAQWMAVDFHQEIKWKRAAAKHLALSCQAGLPLCDFLKPRFCSNF